MTLSSSVLEKNVSPIVADSKFRSVKMDATVENTKIELPEFRRALEEAVTRQGATYQERCIVIFYFEDDDTGADAFVLFYGRIRFRRGSYSEIRKKGSVSCLCVKRENPPDSSSNWKP